MSKDNKQQNTNDNAGNTNDQAQKAECVMSDKARDLLTQSATVLTGIEGHEELVKDINDLLGANASDKTEDATKKAA